VTRGRALARRVAAGVGLEELLRLQRRVDALAEAVGENTALAAPLAERVTALERSLVAPLERRQEARRSSSTRPSAE
jgi:hypothetical protein